jgi:secreted Zn-dependent insulinase-like peptidase
MPRVRVKRRKKNAVDSFPTVEPLSVTVGEDVKTGKSETASFRTLFLADDGDASEARPAPCPLFVLASDPNADIASVCISVHCGARCDEKEWQGIAHALEHAVFLGSGPYPGATELSSFHTKHGGSSNAWTTQESTTYHGCVKNDQLEGAAKRWAAAMAMPVLEAEAMVRELAAVHSEHAGHVQSDAHRTAAVASERAHPDHWFHQFITGSRETLLHEGDSDGTEFAAAVRAHWERHYCLSNMTIVLVSNRPLDELQVIATSTFAVIPRRPTEPPCPRLGCPPAAPLFPQGPESCLIVPVRASRELRLSWQLPPTHAHYRRKPCSVIGHIIGHEGEGSLLAALRAAGLATELTAGVGGSYTDLALFDVCLVLTRRGERNLPAVIRMVFECIALIRQLQGSFPPYIYQELRTTGDIDFNFAERERAEDLAQILGENARWYPVSDLLEGDFVHEELDSALVQQFLALLSPDAVHVQFISKSLRSLVPPELLTRAASELERMVQDGKAEEDEGSTSIGTDGETDEDDDEDDEYDGDGDGEGEKEGALDLSYLVGDVTAGTWTLEHFYAVPYLSAALPASTIADLAALVHDPTTSAIRLPDQNDLMPRSLCLLAPKAECTADPTVIEATPYLSANHLLDVSFGLPKASVIIRLASLYTSATPRLVVLSKLVTKLVMFSLNEFAYTASMAGLEYRLSSGPAGVHLSVSGYSDRLPVLAERVLERLATLEVEQVAYTSVYEALVLTYESWKREAPLDMAFFAADQFLVDSSFTAPTLLAALRSVTRADVEGHLRLLRSHSYKVALGHGNISADEVRRLGTRANELLPSRAPLGRDEYPRRRIVRLPPSSLYRVRYRHPNAAEPNAAVVVLFQAGYDVRPRERVLMALLSTLLEEALMDDLRTKQMLGYVVFSGARNSGSAQAYMVSVQTDKHPVATVERAIFAAVRHHVAALSTLTSRKFDETRDGLVAAYEERYWKLGQKSDNLWREIISGRRAFGWKREAVAALRLLTLAEVVSFAEQLTNPATASVVSVRVYPGATVDVREDKGATEETLDFATATTEEVPYNAIEAIRHTLPTYPNTRKPLFIPFLSDE